MNQPLTRFHAVKKRFVACLSWCAGIGLSPSAIGKARGIRSAPRMARVLDAARSFSDPDEDRQYMAWHVIESDGVSTGSGLEGPTLRRERRIQRDPVRMQEVVEMNDRLADGPSDALGHFLSTTGYRLKDLSDLSMPPKRPRPAVSHQSGSSEQQKSTRRSAMLVAAVVMYTVSLGWGGSDPWIQGAVMDTDSEAVSWTMLGARSRGADSDWVMDVRSGYLRGFSQLEEARTSVLGLFPGYDREMLERAVITFTETAELQALREPPSSRMLLLMARLQERLGDRHTAERWIHIVIQRDDDQLDEALQLRSHLRDAAYRF